MKKLYVLLFCCIAVFYTSGQSNLVFSISQGYIFEVRLGDLSFTRPKPWQIRFDNVPEGKYILRIKVSTNSGYQKEVAYNFEIGKGWEAVYFITPLSDNINYNLAYYLPLSRILPEETVSSNTTASGGRFVQFNGKPVITPELLEELYQIASKKWGEFSKLDYFKAVMPQQYFYTDDILYLQKLFFFDFQRLDFLKLAFHQCVDQANYFRMEKCFSNIFLSGELMDYARENRRK